MEISIKNKKKYKDGLTRDIFMLPIGLGQSFSVCKIAPRK